MLKRFLALLCLLSMVLLSGCWNRREIGNLSIVMGLSVDTKENEPEKIEVTSQIANTKNTSKSGEGGQKSEDSYNNVSIEGDYVFPSIRSSVSKAGSKLYLAHNFVIIFGQDMARKGLGKYMDFFLRDHEMRLSMQLLVARDRGKDILDTSAGFQKIPAMHIKNMIDAQKQTSNGVTADLLDFTTELYSDKAAPLLPMIETSGEGDKKQLQMSGTAVFNKDKMIGELTPYETRGLLWTHGKVNQGVVVASPSNNEHVGIDILHTSGNIKAEIDKNNEITMVMIVKAEGAFGSERGKDNYTTPEGLDKLLAGFSGEIENEIRAALSKSRALKADVFGFSNVVYKKNPKLWETRQNIEWYNLPVRIEVETKITSAGKINQPVSRNDA